MRKREAKIIMDDSELVCCLVRYSRYRNAASDFHEFQLRQRDVPLPKERIWANIGRANP